MESYLPQTEGWTFSSQGMDWSVFVLLFHITIFIILLEVVHVELFDEWWILSYYTVLVKTSWRKPHRGLQSGATKMCLPDHREIVSLNPGDAVAINCREIKRAKLAYALSEGGVENSCMLHPLVLHVQQFEIWSWLASHALEDARDSLQQTESHSMGGNWIIKLGIKLGGKKIILLVCVHNIKLHFLVQN